MPFDPMTRKEQFWAAEAHERLRMLIEDLRGDMIGWRWDFAFVKHNCETAGCAWGYAQTRYGFTAGFTDDRAAEIFSINREGADYIFSGFFTDESCEDITPLMVADALETYLSDHAMPAGLRRG